MQINKVNANEAYIVIKGRRVFFDVKDIPIVKRYSWHISSNGYCRTKVNNVFYNMPEILFGRKTSYTWQFDHLKQDKLDNRRCNLKYCHSIENQARRSLTNNSGAPGLHWNGHSYRVRDRVTKKHRSIREFEVALFYQMINYLKLAGDFEEALYFFDIDCSEEEKELLRHTLLLTHMKQAQELKEAS